MKMRVDRIQAGVRVPAQRDPRDLIFVYDYDKGIPVDGAQKAGPEPENGCDYLVLDSTGWYWEKDTKQGIARFNQNTQEFDLI